MKETGHSVYPYTFGGTVFLVGYENRVHVVSSRHALNLDALTPLCIFVRDGSRQRIPLTSVHYAQPGLISDDYADIALIKVDMPAARRKHARRATLIDLDRSMPDWALYRDTTRFVVLGFPDDLSLVDYEQGVIQNQRCVLHGRYAGPASARYVHSLQVQSGALTTFSGFSGGPVFSWIQRLGFRPQLSLCGVAIQGSVTSGLIHFIESSILMNALEVWGPR
ncbi:serine protease [Polaromonas sp. P1(28)-13]|nr:serine protease [Polaromonas sp. P1(28)-13]